MSNTLRFERLQAHHIPAILEIEREANGAPWSERSFRNELDHKQGVFIVAIQDGEVVAYGGIWLVIDEGHIITLATRQDQRRKGIGRRLIDQLLTEAKNESVVCFTLEVRESNEAALHLYESIGFRRVAIRKHYYPDNQENAIVMWRDEA